MLNIQVKSAAIRTETTSKGNTLHKQECALLRTQGYPLPFEVTVPAGKPYAPGDYTLDESCFKVGRFGGLEIDGYKTTLVPAQVRSVKSA